MRLTQSRVLEVGAQILDKNDAESPTLDQKRQCSNIDCVLEVELREETAKPILRIIMLRSRAGHLGEVVDASGISLRRLEATTRRSLPPCNYTGEVRGRVRPRKVARRYVSLGV